MTSGELRTEFEKFAGLEKYIHFVLTLYEAFPLRKKLFYWQEQLLNDFSNKFVIEPITIESALVIFNHCPIHNYKLINEKVAIVDGNKIVQKVSYKTSQEYFPMANINAPRDLDRYNYPKNVEVMYCEKCREAKEITESNN